MIGFLHGVLLHKQPPHLLLDVHGVGYEIEAPMSTFYELPAVGCEVTLYTHLIVREDAHTLFGFARPAEHLLFRGLIKVNGVGPRLALTILSGISAEGFVRAVRDNDAASLTRLPGIGKKTAERLLMEMRDRIEDWAGNAYTSGEQAAWKTSMPHGPLEEAISALVSLGYKPQEANRMARAVAEDGLGSEDIIRRALQAAVRR